MKVAIIHDWLTVNAGAEKVLENIVSVFPNSDLYTIVDYLGAKGKYRINKLYTSSIQNYPLSRKYYRNYLPLMPNAIQAFDLSKYDLILSSSHAVAKGVKTKPDQLHICYIHSPMRYAWDLRNQYFEEVGIRGVKKYFADFVLNKIRDWDLKSNESIDYFISNSKYISERVRNCYDRESSVIYPPVDIRSYSLESEKHNYYLAASRFVPYKKISLIVESFSKMKHRQLIVIGDGPDFKKIQRLASPNIKLLGYVKKKDMIKMMQKARAFIFAAEEDFGIIPVEAQACGTPVLAFGRGGALETVVDGQTGFYFNEHTTQSLIDVVEKFEQNNSLYTPRDIRKNAEKFSIDRFRREYSAFVKEKYMEFYKK